MAFKRLLALSRPREWRGGSGRRTDGAEATGAAEAERAAEDALLARWLAATTRARVDETARHAWQLYESAEFAHLWYAARDAGERLRASTLTTLYARRASPGGRYPDPREAAAFSERAILSAAATALGIALWQQPPAPASEASAPSDGGGESEGAGQRASEGAASPPPPSVVCLVTYPQASGRPPTILLPAEEPGASGALMLFDLACMLGYISKHTALLDASAPHGVTFLPRNPGITALMHQFAIALLCLDPICPPAWTCHCNLIRRRFTAPPADHAQPTDVISRRDLERG